MTVDESVEHPPPGLLHSNERLRSLIAFGLGPFLGVLSGPILARTLGPDGRGQFAAVAQPVMIAGAIASLGIPAAATYFTAREGSPRGVYRLAIVAGIIPALVTYAGMLWYAAKVASSQGLSYTLVASSWGFVFLLAIVQIRRGVWQGLGRWRILDLERALFAVFRFLGVVVVALCGIASVPWYVVATFGGVGLGGAVLWRSLPRPDNSTKPKIARSRFWLYSMSSSIGTITLIASSRLDQMLFPAAGSSEQLGLYAVAVTIAEVPLVCGSLVARNTLTLASTGSNLREVLSEIWLYIGVGAIGSVILSAAAPFIVPLFFGRSFAPAVGSVIVLCVGTVLGIGALALSAYLSGVGLPFLGSAVPALSLIVTVVGFVLYWGKMSSILAAEISTVSQFVAVLFAMACVCFRRRRRVAHYHANL